MGFAITGQRGWRDNAGRRAARLKSLAVLVQVLLCGEESAALAFDVLARRRRRQGDALELIQALSRIADDERQHRRWLLDVQCTLPCINNDSPLIAAGSQFFVGLACRDAGEHFTRIAALDSAVCWLLAALGKSQPLLFYRAFRRILQDEARHVAISSAYAKRLAAPGKRMEQAAITRHALTAMLAKHSQCFDTLEIDPDRLLMRLRQPPRFLGA
jgi:hypothetical protein